MPPDRIKHLEMLSLIIQRMGQNSFSLKGWCITLIAAIFALGAKDADPRLILVAAVPAVVFWLLDAYYLWQERRFRSLFECVRIGDKDVPLFSMDASNQWHVKYLRSLLSSPTAILYGGLLAVTAAAFVLTRYSTLVVSATTRP